MPSLANTHISLGTPPSILYFYIIYWRGGQADEGKWTSSLANFPQDSPLWFLQVAEWWVPSSTSPEVTACCCQLCRPTAVFGCHAWQPYSTSKTGQITPRWGHFSSGKWRGGREEPFLPHTAVLNHAGLRTVSKMIFPAGAVWLWGKHVRSRKVDKLKNHVVCPKKSLTLLRTAL